MKRSFTIMTAVLLTASALAQAPQKMSYQAVIRDDNSVLVKSQSVGMRISILQGVNPVYVETHATNTNANGLITIEIGNGTVVSGVFASIDWSAGTYSIKTETDPAGGVNYTAIVGTSQLLSVPYALYAKTGENVTGTVAIANGGTGATSISGAKTSLGLGNVDNTTDLLKPVSTATQTALDLKAPLASPTFTGTPLATTATPGTNTTQIATTEFVTSAVAASVPAHYIGELYGGGVVFYVDRTGNHGLICSMIDLSTLQSWSNVSSTLIGTTAQSDWNGQGNTNAIIGQSLHTSSAAILCDNYTNINYGTGAYSDWYLPSRGELNNLWNNIYQVQKALDSDGNGATTAIIATYYWSSSEYISLNAWYVDLAYGGTNLSNKSSTHYVRAVRAF
jgi:hypothetical protein